VLYRLLYALVLRRIPPESAHALAARGVSLAHRLGLLRVLGRPDPALAVEALGLRFESPLGVAAGVDKDASWFGGLGALGFGAVEIGTVTPLAQEGNPRPRVRRLTADRALQNSMGFPNPGADAVAARLERRSGPTIVGVNVGRSKGATAEQAAGDYRATVLRLAPLADYLVLNVSSPNTPGLRDLQAVEPLRGIVAAVREALAELAIERPVLVKIAPDLADEDVDAIADLALELALDGIVATNTTVARAGLRTPGVPAAGGVSGAPLKARSLEVLRRLRARTGDRLVLVSAGGIETADDVWERLQAGATLVQAYTGFVYGGPGWARKVNRDLARRLRGRTPPAGVEPASRA
jgi:dihydroorotate dehydrogenase